MPQTFLQRLRRRFRPAPLATLEQQAATLRALIDGTADGVWAKDRSGVYQLVNGAAARVLGRPRHEIIGRRDEDFFPADAIAASNALDAQAIASGGSVTGSSCVRAPDGTVRHYNTTRTVWRDANGEVIGVVGVSRDITDSVRAAEVLRANEERYRTLVEDSPEAIVLHRDGVMLYINNTGARLLGRSADEIVGRCIYDFAHADSVEPMATAVRMRNRGEFNGRAREYRLVAANGQVVDVEALSVPIVHEGVPAVQTVLRDVTARRAAEAALRDREARLRLVMQQIPAVLWATDSAARVTSVLGAGLGEFGIDPAQIIGARIGDYFTGEQDIAPVHATTTALGGRSTSFEFQWSGRSVACSIEPLRAATGEIQGTIGLAVDITDRKALETQLTYRAFHDPLTGLANRELFRNRLTHALTRVGRGVHVAVIFLDLDDFKTVNDSLGHTEGDRLLQAVASRLTTSVRGHDTVARFGGDEFAILLEGMERPDEALEVVSRVEAALAAPVSLRGRKMHVSGSIGLAHANVGETADEVLRNADVAMYRAKDLEDERHAIYESHMHAAVMDRLELESDLRVAVERDELYLLFQPVVALDTGEVQGAEALLRWQHPRRGALEPSVFVPIAEETGLIVDIGRWVIEESCRALKSWHAMARAGAPALSTDLRIGINISGYQFRSDAFLETVRATIASTGVTAHRVVLEITESTVMGRSADALKRLHALKSLGVQLAIDDFGTGYSSLGYLQRFPIDVLKIDRSFVQGVTEGGTNAALTRTILTLGELMQLRTLAEGVETEAQRVELLRLGCRFGQGYLFSRPLVLGDFPGWAARHLADWSPTSPLERSVTREYEIAALRAEHAKSRVGP